MPAEITNAIESIQAMLAGVPPALYAIVFLGGPTAAWILYRVVVAPRSRRDLDDDTDLLWICENCRSANELRLSHCYRCGYDRDRTVGDLQVVDGRGLIALGRASDLPGSATAKQDGPVSNVPDGPGIPVGPGRPTPADGAPGPIIPVLTGRPEVQRPRRAVITGSPQHPVTSEDAVVVEDRPA
jgi:hypothetical protein